MKTCLPRSQWSPQPQDQGPGDESEVTQEVADREHWYPCPCHLYVLPSYTSCFPAGCLPGPTMMLSIQPVLMLGAGKERDSLIDRAGPGSRPGEPGPPRRAEQAAVN